MKNINRRRDSIKKQFKRIDELEEKNRIQKDFLVLFGVAFIIFLGLIIIIGESKLDIEKELQECQENVINDSWVIKSERKINLTAIDGFKLGCPILMKEGVQFIIIKK